MLRKILFSAICLSLCASSLSAQKRKAKRETDNTDYPAEIAKNIKDYNLDEADNLLDKWEAKLDKARKEHPKNLASMRNQILNMRNLMERVEKIELIDTLHVCADDFFRSYLLSSDAGELLDPSELPDEYAAAHPKVVFRPQSGNEMIWSMPSAKDNRQIVSSLILDDGTMSHPESLGDEISAEGNPEYPFIVDDGMTIYFAADGANSLGGYDIFMTRRSVDGDVLQAQNLGMPFNSPYNDFMMAIDDARNIGWWASDREQIPDTLTVYVFRPSSMRVNYPSDEPDLASKALLKDIELSGSVDEAVAEHESYGYPDSPEFVLPLGNGKVYTRMDQFRNAAAAQAMGELLQRQGELAEMETLLAKLRSKYGKGDLKLTKEISNLERRVAETSGAVSRLSNKVVSLETGKRK